MEKEEETKINWTPVIVTGLVVVGVVALALIANDATRHWDVNIDRLGYG
jgi:hypothetical protein